MTSIHEWIGSLRHRGLQLWMEGEDLKYRAPRGAIDTSDLADLRARKTELIAFLRAGSGSGDSATRISRVPRTGNMPQSYAQQRLWFLYHLDGPGAAYNIVSQHCLSGPLDPAILEQSFRELCRRHEILRTTFSTENGVPVQIISQEVRLPFIVTSVSDAAEALRLAEEEAIHVFNLTTGPLLSVRLLRCDAENHILLLTAHHIICDGWSLGLLFGELSALYRAFRHGQESPLPGPELHYVDYAQWQREWLTPAVLETQLHYWRRLKDAPPLLDLFADGPHSAELSSRGAVESIRIEPDQARRFKLLCQASGVTVFMGMLAVLQALLARHTGQRDIVIGTQVAGRTRNEMEQVLGFFVNTLPLRVDVDVTRPFVALLEQVKQTTLDAMAHQETPFEKIVEMLQPERTPGRNPLVQVMFLWQNARMDTLSLNDVQVQPFTGVARSTSKFDLTLEMGEIGNGFEGVLEYRTDLFDSRLIRQFGTHLETFFSSIVEYPDRPLASLPMLAAQEREQLLGQGLGERVPLPGEDTIAEQFEHQARTHPARPAVVFREVQLTYAELDSRASRLADSLRGLGIGPEKPVALFLDPSIELIVAMLGVVKAGGAYLPLDTRAPKARLAVMLKDSTASVVLTIESLHSLLPSSNAKTVFLDRELPQAVSAVTRAPDPEHIAYIIYTSGSTGTPKGVMVSNRAVLNLTEWLACEAFQKQEAVRTALIASPAFDASVQQIFGCLLNGHTLYPVDMETRRNGARLWRFFEDHAIELADCTPSLLAILCNTVPDNLNLALRCFLVGGEALSASLVGDFYRQDPLRYISLINVYGPTECCVDSTFFPIAKAEDRSIMSIGNGISNSEIYILDRHGHPTPEAVAGEIYIAGTGLGRGYWRRPALTASAFVPHPFRVGERLYRTGDHGYWNANGQIEFLGRNDDQVKIRGHRIQLGDIETHLGLHSNVRQAVVIARKVSATHNELVAYLAGDSSLTIDELRRFVGDSLPEYMIPAHFVLLDKLPLNSSGKVDRKLLPEPDETHALRRDSEFIAPRNSAENALAAIWEAVLGRKPIGIHDHYIALGGDSIKALQISARLREIGFKLELSDLFLHSTIEALAPYLRALKDANNQEEAAGEVPLMPVQLRFLHEFEGKLHHFNQSVLLSSSERLEEEPLRRALDSIVQHHDMLRAKFSHLDDGWVQKVDLTGSADFKVVDLTQSSLAALTQHASITQSSFVLDVGPLFRAVLYRVVDGDRLFLCAHHLVVDAVSWRILIEDLEAAYRSAKTGSAIHLPSRTTPFRGWTNRLLALAKSGELTAEVSPHREISSALPLDRNGPFCLVRECLTHSLKLSRTLTAGVLRESHKAYNTEVNDILLTALTRALRRFSGRSASRIWLEGHGREPLFPNADVSRTVGWFTAIYPVVLDLGPTEEIDRNIKLVKETLRVIPRKGIAYGLLRYLAPPDVRHQFSEESSGIIFNYLGQFEAAKGPSLFTRASEDCGPMADIDATFSHDIEINALANDDCLEFHVSYNPKRFYSDTISSLSRRYVEELEALVEHANSRQQPELTPSDVDYSGFNLDEMESFLNNLQEER